jgi:hypothetical protein
MSRHLPRLLRAHALALVVLSLSASRAAQAQAPGPAPPIPMAVDLKKVPVGVWADYDMAMGKMPPMKSRMALVAKGAGTSTIEMTMEGGMLAMTGGKLLLQTIVSNDQSAEKPIKKSVMQIGDNAPMELPISADQQHQFRKPNPKSLVGEETIKVAAGSYKTKHYRDKTPDGDVFDVWVSPDVPPFGLVKIVVEPKSAQMAQAGGPLSIELQGTGKNAKMAITKPARPYDQAALMGEVMGGMKGPGPGGPGAGAPPPAPAAAGAPKK